MKAKKVLAQILAGLAVASMSTLVLAPLSGAEFDVRLAAVGLLLVFVFGGLATLLHR
ncbi:hypothetical protein [Devosia salina]|uniref:Uncharacterized protein n=1 Tax=Devosia salina TaxID=2860336 RepID=A0ABX8WLG4_9HYPH|nr:hypothetical protein [Devosia salina]QYO78859.1 hypothetical protein K1X15_10120 [Devosia salina]